ncbi:MAG: DUF3021 family protein [Aeriscardovia sp.]|nr:DUF3021 family protein [Aeriscardovia sp.]MBR3462443.1 DUF3021 family protein [Clostridiales bacterium]MCR4766953.1 DUF3021 family protein [Saccharofermentans sp.]
MKEHIKDNLINFFIIVTMVNIVIFICGSLFAPDQNITYAAFIVPIIDGILGSIPGLIMYSKRELTVKQMIIREVIQFFMVEIIILLFSFGFSGFRIENLNMMAIVALSVAAVYISVWVIRFFLDSRKAKKMTDDLKMFQKSLSGKAN